MGEKVTHDTLQESVDAFMQLPSVPVRLRGRVHPVYALKTSNTLQTRLCVRVFTHTQTHTHTNTHTHTHVMQKTIERSKVNCVQVFTLTHCVQVFTHTHCVQVFTHTQCVHFSHTHTHDTIQTMERSKV